LKVVEDGVQYIRPDLHCTISLAPKPISVCAAMVALSTVATEISE